MTSPLLILICSAVSVGALGSFLLLLVFGVNKWEELDYNAASLTKYVNATSNIQVVLSTKINWFTEFRVQSGSTWTTYYLYKEYNNVWKQCDDLSDAARAELNRLNITKTKCYNFVVEYDEESDNSALTINGKAIARLQNSAASCFIVSIIDLVVAAGVGLFAIITKQVTAFMVAGVLYSMAGLFTIFGLSIFHTKNFYERTECHTIRFYPSSTCESRDVKMLWPAPVAWVGVIVCFIACFLWLFLTRALRVIKAKTML